MRGLAATGLGSMKAKDAVSDLFVALDHKVAEAAASIGQLCAGNECDQLAGKLGSVPFDVVTSGLDQVLFRAPADVSDDIKVEDRGSRPRARHGRGEPVPPRRAGQVAQDLVGAREAVDRPGGARDERIAWSRGGTADEARLSVLGRCRPPRVARAAEGRRASSLFSTNWEDDGGVSIGHVWERVGSAPIPDVGRRRRRAWRGTPTS